MDNNYDDGNYGYDIFPPNKEQPPKKKKNMKHGFVKGMVFGMATILAVGGISYGSIAIYENINPRTTASISQNATSTAPQSTQVPETSQGNSGDNNGSGSNDKSDSSSGSQNNSGATESSGTSGTTADSSNETIKQNEPGEEMTIPEIAKKLTPSTVGIETKGASSSMDMFGQQQQPTEDTTISSGSGIILTSDGYILTNAHVVEDGTSYTVTLSDGTTHDATLYGMDTVKDLAILKIDATDLTAAEFGNSEKLAVGETVVAIGNPMGVELSGSVTSGLVSALNRTMEIDGTTYKLIQTNASISPGNSGGPLINSSGQVIGINTAKIVATGAEGIGFAMPINDIISDINNLMKNGPELLKSQNLILGFTGQTIDEQTAKYYDIPQGVFVAEVEQGTGAAYAGLQSGDIIVKADGKEITSMDELETIKTNHKAGESMTLTLYRNGQQFEAKVVLSSLTDNNSN